MTEPSKPAAPIDPRRAALLGAADPSDRPATGDSVPPGAGASFLAAPTSAGRLARSRKRLVGGLAAAAVLAVGGVAVARPGTSGADGYRTATVGVHPVHQVLSGVATIEPISQASVAFPVGGTVQSVLAEVGDTVAVGQTLATLDPQDLHDALDADQAALDKAELILEKALAGEDVSALVGSGAGRSTGPATASGSAAPSASTASGSDGSSSATGTSSAAVSPTVTATAARASSSSSASASATTVPAGTAGGSGGSPAGATGASELRSAQQAVLDAQRQADEDLSSAQAALDSATAVCAAVGQPGPDDADTQTHVSAAPSDETSTSSTTSTSPGSTTTNLSSTTTNPSSTTTTVAASDDGDQLDSCRTALVMVLDAQRVVARDQQAVADASVAYEQLLDRRATASASTSTSSASAPAATSTDTAASGGTSSSSRSPSAAAASASSSASGDTASTLTPSAADLVKYQKAVDAAGAAVAVAEQAINQASVISPIAGTVVSVGLEVGDDVDPASTTATVVVVGQGGFEATTSVAVTDLGDLEVGQAATIVPDGTPSSIGGEVVRIGVAGTASGSTTTYPVTIALTGASDAEQEALGNGAIASSSITTDAASDALAVPTSAVTTDGTRHTVEVVDGGNVTETSVTVGAVGQAWTEITKGVSDGQEVVLADLSEPLPGSATETPSSTRSGQGRDGQSGPPAGFEGGRQRGAGGQGARTGG